MNIYLKSAVISISLAAISLASYNFFASGSVASDNAAPAANLSTPNTSSPTTATNESPKNSDESQATPTTSAAATSNIIFNRDYKAVPISAKNDDNIGEFYTKTNLCSGPTVVEFFSYGCPGCYMAEKKFQEWESTKPRDIQFKRVPVNFHSGWDVLAKIYFTNEELDITEDLHTQTFEWVQKRPNPMVPVSTTEVEDFIKGELAKNPELAKKVTIENYMNILNSSALNIKLNRSMEMFAKYGLESSPSVIINNQYVVTVGQAQTLDNFIAIIKELAKGKTSCDKTTS